jgi:hypothetical protein
MTLLDHFDSALDVVCHAQSGHDDGQPSPSESRHGDFVLNIAELAPAAATSAQYPHIEQLLEQHVLLLPAERVCGIEVGDTVGELAQRTAQLVVFAVVVAALDAIAAHHGRLPVVIVGLVGVEVDLGKLARATPQRATSDAPS